MFRLRLALRCTVGGIISEFFRPRMHFLQNHLIINFSIYRVGIIRIFILLGTLSTLFSHFVSVTVTDLYFTYHL